MTQTAAERARELAELFCKIADPEFGRRVDFVNKATAKITAEILAAEKRGMERAAALVRGRGKDEFDNAMADAILDLAGGGE